MRLTHVSVILLLLILHKVKHTYSDELPSHVTESRVKNNSQLHLAEIPEARVRGRRHVMFNFDSSTTTCRVGSNNVQCLPPFKNIAHGQSVQITSSCGVRKTQRLCRSDGTCQICGPSTHQARYLREYLTDSHDPQNQTCWASGYVRAGGLNQAVNLTLSLGKRFEVYYISLQPCSLGSLPDSIAIYKSSDFGRTWRPWHFFSTDCFRAFGLPTTDEHNSHITSANLQEVLCVALQPQESYLNRQMRRRRSMGAHRASTSGENVPNLANHDASPDWVIAFSTTLGRPATRPWSPALVDWMTMTDIRISLMRFPPSLGVGDYRITKRNAPLQTKISPHRTFPFSFPSQEQRLSQAHRALPTSHLSSHSFRIPRKVNDTSYRDLTLPDLQSRTFISPNDTNEIDHQLRDPFETDIPPASLFGTEPDILSETEFYAFADLAIGGRCKCNGHASECVVGPNGKLRCACEHNTEGDDCERCKSGYMDRPWERATAQHANSCTKCDCNLHSDECRFSNGLYLMSNRISGGICENCRHNTAGRNCQHCAEGFYRDWTKPISHEHVCLPCRCHPIGSIVRHDCDRRSGQCRCKQGVTGLTCDRCQDGYHQTRSPTNPCTKDISPQAVALAHTPVDIHCTPCNTNKERIRLKKFCRKDAVFQANFKSRELHGTMARFEMQVTQIWRLNSQALAETKPIYWPKVTGQANLNRPADTEELYNDDEERPSAPLIPVWVRLNELRCKCPEIELGISYLIVTDFESHAHKGRMEFLFTPKTALLPWRPTWRRRLIRFKRKQNRGACDRYRDSGKLRSLLTSASHRGTAGVTWYTTQSASVPQAQRPQPGYAQPTMLPAHRTRNQFYEGNWRYGSIRPP